MRNKSNSAFCTYIFSICISLLSISQLIAQENGFYEIKVNSTISKESSNKATKSDREEFYDLARRLHPTAYAENNSFLKVKHDESSTTRFSFNDTKSFSLLNQDISKFKNVELITIKLSSINDLNNKLDLTDISDFNNLKYIYIKCHFNCTEQQIQEFLNYDSSIRVFYKIENPS